MLSIGFNQTCKDRIKGNIIYSLKNLRTLHLRIQQHSNNALYLANKFKKDGLKTEFD